MDDFYPSMNGVIEVMDNQAKELIKLGHEVVVVVPTIDKNYKDDFPYKVIRIPSIPIKNLIYKAAICKMNKPLKNKLLKENFDIIHIHSPFLVGSFGVKIAKKLKIPVVGTMHTQFEDDIKKFVKLDIIVKKVIKQVCKVYDSTNMNYAVNNATVGVYKKYGVKSKIKIMLSGTDFRPLDKKEEKQAIDLVNKKLNLHKNDLVFSFVGRLTTVKNIPFLIDSLSYIKEKGIKFKMLFVGPFEDEELIRNYVTEKNLDNEIIYVGKVTDREYLKKIYKRSKLFLFPSLYDTNSLVQKEAASQKIPTVFIKGAVTADLVTDKINGFLADNDYKKYGDLVIKILNNDKLYKKVSEGAFNDLYIHWEELAKDLENEYDKLIQK